MAPVIIGIGCVTFLVDWLNNSFCPLQRVRTRFKDFIEELNQVVDNIVSRDLQRIIRNTVRTSSFAFLKIV